MPERACYKQTSCAENYVRTKYEKRKITQISLTSTVQKKNTETTQST
jgi:hypothetical protein